MNKIEQLYEGKAKKVFSTEDPNVVIVSYKDDATAFDGLKKGTITGKGAINNQMTNFLMRQLEKAGVPTHFIEELSERETTVKKVSIVPLEVIIRNISAGSFAKRYGVEEGIVFDAPTVEFSYKNDDLHDPLINDHHAVALKLATWEEIELIKKYAFQVNDFLKAELAACGVTLVDFKLEFGKTADGTIVLQDGRKAGQGPFPPGPGQRGGGLSGDEPPSHGEISHGFRHHRRSGRPHHYLRIGQPRRAGPHAAPGRGSCRGRSFAFPAQA